MEEMHRARYGKSLRRSFDAFPRHTNVPKECSPTWKIWGAVYGRLNYIGMIG